MVERDVILFYAAQNGYKIENRVCSGGTDKKFAKLRGSQKLSPSSVLVH